MRASPWTVVFFALRCSVVRSPVSSAWLAYATPAYRPLLAKQRLRFVVAPLAIAAACFAVLLAPESVLPMPLTERVVWLAVLDYLLVSYHFAAQDFGLLCLYRARAGRALEATTRRLDRWFALVVGGGFVVVAEALAGSIAFQDRWIDPLLGAVGADLFARTLRDGGIVLVVILTALMLRVELRSQRPSLPRVAYVLGLSAMVLFAFLARDPFLFLVLWSVQHRSAAMGLASLAASGGTQEPATRWQRLLVPINRRGWAVLLVLAVASTLLLPLLEVEAVADRIRLCRPHLRRGGVVAALLALRAGAAGPGLRNRLHPLFAGSRRLPLLLARREAGRPRPAAVMTFASSGPRRDMSAIVRGAATALRASPLENLMSHQAAAFIDRDCGKAARLRTSRQRKRILSVESFPRSETHELLSVALLVALGYGPET